MIVVALLLARSEPIPAPPGVPAVHVLPHECTSEGPDEARLPLREQAVYPVRTLEVGPLVLDDSLTLLPAYPLLDFNAEIRLIDLVPGPTGLMYGVERRGRIVVFDDRPDVETWDVFLDLRPLVESEFVEDGLLGLAFEPADSRFYVFYRAKDRTTFGMSVVSRFTRSADGRTADAESEERLLTLPRVSRGHNGGPVAFGPDGYLYIALGDSGGDGTDPADVANDLTSLFASILRIDVSSEQGYAIPPDNPFVSVPGACHEIWAKGLRNPWRLSFDQETGDLWVGDVGQALYEEINLVRRGGFYGWSVTEGPVCSPHRGPPLAPGVSPPAVTECEMTGISHAVIAHRYEPAGPPNTAGVSAIIGGHVYRGTAIPALVGRYVYADFGGAIFGAELEGHDAVGVRVLHPRISNVSSLVARPDGELLLVVSHPNPAVNEDGVYLLTRKLESVYEVDLSSDENAAGIVASTGVMVDPINQFLFPRESGIEARVTLEVPLGGVASPSALRVTAVLFHEAGYLEVFLGVPGSDFRQALRLDGHPPPANPLARVDLALTPEEAAADVLTVKLVMFVDAAAAVPFDTRVERVELLQ